MLKRFALIFAATAGLAIPALSPLSPQPPKPHGVLPPQACFAAYPAPLQPLLCGQDNGAKPS